MVDDPGELRSAVQLSLSGFADVRYVETVVEYGPVGAQPGGAQTASQPRYVLASNGQEYIIKGPSFTPQHREVGVNEYVVARLADALGLPVLDYRFLLNQGEVCFASAWMEAPTFYTEITEARFQQCINADAVYLLIPFDCWVVNQDRHDKNLLVRRRSAPTGAPSADVLTMLLNDHGHCLMMPGVHAATLATRQSVSASQCIRLPYLASAITDYGRFAAAVAIIENLDVELIRLALRAIPEAWLDVGERELVLQFLLERRAMLRSLLNADKGLFPALQGAML